MEDASSTTVGRATTTTFPVLLDGVVSRERLDQLLALEAEYDELDFKEHVDPNKTADVVKISKDVAAMQSLPDGGYILVGVDDRGNPSSSHGTLNPSHFDPATLASKLAKYMPEPGITTRIHEVEGAQVAIIYVQPARRFGFTIMSTTGQYESTPGRPKVEFRQGDIFVRRNTKSVRMQVEDLPRVLEPFADRIREEERHRLGDVVANIQQGQRGVAIASGPAGALTWQLALEDFDAAFLEALRLNESVAIRHFSLSIRGEIERLLQADDATSLGVLLDRAISALATAITYDRRDVFENLLRSFTKGYRAGLGAEGYVPPTLQGKSQRLWWEIATRVEAAGGLAVRLDAWWAIQPLAIQAAGTASDRYVSWLRHALTEAANANLLVTTDGKPMAGPMVAVARKHTERLPALRPDFPGGLDEFELNTAPQLSDKVLDSIAQFDLLWCVMAVAMGGGATYQHYPSFAAFYSYRVEPGIVALLSDPRVRDSVVPGLSEESLRAALTTVIETAQGEALNQFHRSWRLESPVALDFLG